MEANRTQVSKKTPKRDEAAKRADKRTAKIGGWTGSQNDVTDGIFGDFCAKLGVNHIREYEGTTMQEQQAAHAKTMELTKHVADLQAALEYERSRKPGLDAGRHQKTIKHSKQKMKSFKFETRTIPIADNDELQADSDAVATEVDEL